MGPFEIVREKLNQATALLDEKGIDLWLTFVRETSQVRDPCLDLILDLELTWQSALLISRSGERVAIVGRMDADNVEQVGGYSTVTCYDQSIRPALLDHLSRLDPQQIALNYSLNDPAADGLTHGMRRLLDTYLAGTVYADRLTSAEEIVGALRGRKSPAEVERIRAAVETSEDIFRQAGKVIRPGLTEQEFAQAFLDAVEREKLGLAWGADHCPTVTAGPHSPVGHAGPGDTVIGRGHLVQVDFGVEKNGFVADLQRTWYLLEDGEKDPPEEVTAAWEAARAALEAGRAALRPGAKGWEVDQAARETLVKAGYPEYMHAFGHHVGRVAHDGATVLGPRWERYGTSIEGAIEAGNVFAIELGVRVEERGYIGCEEDVLVTADGAKYLSQPQMTLWCVGEKT